MYYEKVQRALMDQLLALMIQLEQVTQQLEEQKQIANNEIADNERRKLRKKEKKDKRKDKKDSQLKFEQESAKSVEEWRNNLLENENFIKVSQTSLEQEIESNSTDWHMWKRVAEERDEQVQEAKKSSHKLVLAAFKFDKENQKLREILAAVRVQLENKRSGKAVTQVPDENNEIQDSPNET